MQYFHIDSSYAPRGKRLLSVGETLRTDIASANPYYERMCDLNHVLPVYNRERRLREFLRSNDVNAFPSGELAKCFDGIIDTYIRALREMEFENVRREKYADRPSRTRCIWLSDSIDGARYWLSRLEKVETARIVRVEVEGVLHQADGKLLSPDSSSISELRQAADRYWSGVLTPESEREILLEGSITVVAIERS
ncbi:DUF2441 domain-containing protein [Stenotrophomonas maltophilia]|uniref:DUF2441 domain-containing protein n=1 Tax=Stenotrophomonas maltophilia TaxID=40324 RepID=UPI001110E5F4|nr:DUF2441 domain-containing protein [Stenotrophomonas maltophilia]TIL14106.1 DUF2441 domain-containing protein [Stenotrophomonas maltophilia]